MEKLSKMSDMCDFIGQANALLLYKILCLANFNISLLKYFLRECKLVFVDTY